MQHVRPAGLTHAALALALLAAAWLPGQAQAQIVASVTPTVTLGSPNTYTYTVSDDPTSTDTIGEFDLAVPTTAALTNVAAPTGWLVFYTTGDTAVQWQSTDASLDIQPGSSLSGFRFQSALPPGPETYKVESFVTGNSANGTTLGPATAPAVPEPSSVAAFACGGLGLLALALRARRRRTA